MKSIVRIFIRFVIAVVGIALLLLCVNGIFLVVWGYHMQNRSQVGSHIVSIAQDLTKQGDTYVLNKKGEKVLQEWYQWGMLLDGKGAVVWAKNLPEELPRQYSLQQVAQFTRWYLMDYPVDVWIHDDGPVSYTHLLKNSSRVMSRADTIFSNVRMVGLLRFRSKCPKNPGLIPAFRARPS